MKLESDKIIIEFNLSQYSKDNFKHITDSGLTEITRTKIIDFISKSNIEKLVNIKSESHESIMKYLKVIKIEKGSKVIVKFI